MPKSHLQLIEEFEAKLLAAIIDCNQEALSYLMHPHFVFTDEEGHVYSGIRNIPLVKTPLKVNSIEVTERTISFFNNVVIVNSFEKRSSTFSGLSYERQYRITRVWKFSGKQWKLIAATMFAL